jgi:hypothetical protein
VVVPDHELGEPALVDQNPLDELVRLERGQAIVEREHHRVVDRGLGQGLESLVPGREAERCLLRP